MGNRKKLLRKVKQELKRSGSVKDEPKKEEPTSVALAGGGITMGTGTKVVPNSSTSEAQPAICPDVLIVRKETPKLPPIVTQARLANFRIASDSDSDTFDPLASPSRRSSNDSMTNKLDIQSDDSDFCGQDSYQKTGIIGKENADDSDSSGIDLNEQSTSSNFRGRQRHASGHPRKSISASASFDFEERPTGRKKKDKRRWTKLPPLDLNRKPHQLINTWEIWSKVGPPGKKAEAYGPWGIRNPGTECYAIAVMQALIACNSFIDYANKNKETNDLSYAINAVLHKYLRRENFTLTPMLQQTEIYRANYQEDAYFFLNELVDKYLKENLVSFEIVHCTFCACGYHSEVIDKQHILRLYLEDWDELCEETFRRLVKRRLAIEGEVEGKCEKCKTCHLKRRDRISMPFPKILIIYLMQFHWSNAEGDHVKIGKLVEFPEEFIAEPMFEMCRHTTSETWYDLASVIYHTGRNLNSGHYTAEIYRGDDRFYADDGKVDFRMPVNGEIPYLAIYQLREEGTLSTEEFPPL